MLEREYQQHLIARLRRRFPGCVVLKNDPTYIQGFPDLLLLWRDRWAALEVKASERARERPNQKYHVEGLNEMSFAAFIYPENEEEVLDAIQLSFEPRRSARLSQR